jgi:dethiobiotin synthetase
VSEELRSGDERPHVPVSEELRRGDERPHVPVNLLVVTGTGTGVGKTAVTAAIATLALAAGRSVAVVKLAQTGVGPGEESDVDAVVRLCGLVETRELVRYPEPLAPATAARRSGATPLRADAMVAAVRQLADRDLVLVEGAGGVLVRLDDRGATAADVAAGVDAAVLVVAAAGLGTLNATALTCEALRQRGLRCAGVVIGSWPPVPELACRANLTDLPAYAGAPLLGALPAGAGDLDRDAFRTAARQGLGPALGGTWSADRMGS